jgi:ABC-type multidrug transport system permease subunit
VQIQYLSKFISLREILGELHLIANLDIFANSLEYQEIKLIALILLFIWIFFIFFLFKIVYQNRNNLDEPNFV